MHTVEAKEWKSGNMHKNESLGLTLIAREQSATFAIRLLCVRQAPLGLPVVPEV